MDEPFQKQTGRDIKDSLKWEAISKKRTGHKKRVELENVSSAKKYFQKRRIKTTH